MVKINEIKKQQSSEFLFVLFMEPNVPNFGTDEKNCFLTREIMKQGVFHCDRLFEEY